MRWLICKPVAMSSGAETLDLGQAQQQKMTNFVSLIEK
jgi:hypothetical protein